MSADPTPSSDTVNSAPSYAPPDRTGFSARLGGRVAMMVLVPVGAVQLWAINAGPDVLVWMGAVATLSGIAAGFYAFWATIDH